MAVYALTMPSCPINKSPQSGNIIDKLGLRAFTLFKQHDRTNIQSPPSGSPKPNRPNRSTHAIMDMSITPFMPNFFRQTGISSMQSVSLICDREIRAGGDSPFHAAVQRQRQQTVGRTDTGGGRHDIRTATPCGPYFWLGPPLR